MIRRNLKVYFFVSLEHPIVPFTLPKTVSHVWAELEDKEEEKQAEKGSSEVRGIRRVTWKIKRTIPAVCLYVWRISSCPMGRNRFTTTHSHILTFHNKGSITITTERRNKTTAWQLVKVYKCVHKGFLQQIYTPIPLCEGVQDVVQRVQDVAKV